MAKYYDLYTFENIRGVKLSRAITAKKYHEYGHMYVDVLAPVHISFKSVSVFENWCKRSDVKAVEYV